MNKPDSQPAHACLLFLIIQNANNAIFTRIGTHPTHPKKKTRIVQGSVVAEEDAPSAKPPRNIIPNAQFAARIFPTMLIIVVMIRSFLLEVFIYRDLVLIEIFPALSMILAISALYPVLFANQGYIHFILNS